MRFGDLSVTRREQFSHFSEIRGTDIVQGKIFEHIFAPNGGYCVHYPSNLFHNSRSFDWGILKVYSWLSLTAYFGDFLVLSGILLVISFLMSLSLGSIALVWFPSMLKKRKEKLKFLHWLSFFSTETIGGQYRRGRGLLRDNSLRSKRFCAVREQRITPHFSCGQNAENPVLRSLLHVNAC